MNQQRSRRFRASQEAKEKEDERLKNLELWERMCDLAFTISMSLTSLLRMHRDG